jgi:predicted ATPase with chaperone activity
MLRSNNRSVLLLEELPEFSRSVVENSVALREKLESFRRNSNERK